MRHSKRMGRVAGCAVVATPVLFRPCLSPEGSGSKEPGTQSRSERRTGRSTGRTGHGGGPWQSVGRRGGVGWIGASSLSLATAQSFTGAARWLAGRVVFSSSSCFVVLARRLGAGGGGGGAQVATRERAPPVCRGPAGRVRVESGGGWVL
jgi:hypothetical protein